MSQITKSSRTDIEVPFANGVSTFIDVTDGIPKWKDTNGFIEPISNYIDTTIENVGTGSEVYVDGTNGPSQMRTITQGANVVVTQNANDIEISVPSVVGTSLYYGSFFSTAIQTTAGNEEKLMTFNNTALSAGVSIVSNSQIKVANAGIYNLQFSAQLRKTQGGNAENIYIYFKKNGVAITNSNTSITLANNNDLVVASWNFFESLTANQYLEIAWWTTDQHIQLYYDAGSANYPAIPSVIATLNRVG
jgi:hypothetical protein